jgi:heterotetrameric sarcosine oxidase gamma subunit
VTGFRPIRLSAMHQAHRARAAVFRDEGDWRIPERYDAPDAEAAGALASVGIADTSACGKLGLRGAAVDALVRTLASAEGLAPGATARLPLNGATVVVARLGEDELLVLTAPAHLAAVAELLSRAAAAAGCVHLTDLTAGYSAIDLVGPRVDAMLARVAPFDLDPAGRALPGAVVQGELARARAILLRLDHLRAPGVRALVAREHGAFVWDALVDAGRDLDLVLVGAAARSLLGADL